MTTFEFYFSFFGLLLGLSVAEVASGLARMLRARDRVRLGLLTPLLGVLVLLDVSSFWVIAWRSLQDVPISHLTIYTGLVVALAYYVAAAVVFPTDPERWTTLDDYYDGHKRWVVGGVLFSNAVGFGTRLASGLAVDFNPFEIGLTAVFFGVLVALLFVRNRRANAVLLALHCATNLVLVLEPAAARAPVAG